MLVEIPADNILNIHVFRIFPANQDLTFHVDYLQ